MFSSWAQLKKLSSAVIHVDIRKAFNSVLVEGVVGPVVGRSDRAKVMARLGWTEGEKQHLEATLQGREHETALVGMAPDVVPSWPIGIRHERRHLQVAGRRRWLARERRALELSQDMCDFGVCTVDISVVKQAI